MVCCLPVFGRAQDTQQLRHAFAAAVGSEAAAAELCASLEAKKEKSALEWGYLGGGKALAAKFAVNPFTKLRLVTEANRCFDRALSLAPQHTEVHYLRLAMQSQLPSFLGQSDAVDEDKRFLIGSLGSTCREDAVLCNQVTSLLTEHVSCSPSEKEKIARTVK